MSYFKFSVGPWNVSEGAQVFGPAVRPSVPLEEKIEKFAEIGLYGVQFHDDDVVPDINNMSQKAIIEYARDVRALLNKYNLVAEFVAPRLWFDPQTNDGAYTASKKENYDFAIWRSLRSVDIAKALGTRHIQLWLAREGTICYESKDSVKKILQMRDAWNTILQYDPAIRILVEPKPNEPIDRSYCGTSGHALAIGAMTVDPSRVGICVESAHAILAGLDPVYEMAIAIASSKLWGVHLNDQNGMKFDQDKTFGAENLRSAFNQIKLLMENDFGANGEMVGLDVQSMRTQNVDDCYRHIINSMKVVEFMEEKVKKFDYEFQAKCIKDQNLEKLEMYVIELLLKG